VWNVCSCDDRVRTLEEEVRALRVRVEQLEGELKSVDWAW
jgi:hypothetical protein